MSDSEKTGVKNNLAQMVSPHSISVYAEAAGHSEVTDEALTFLSSNVTEMLYDILKVSDVGHSRASFHLIHEVLSI